LYYFESLLKNRKDFEKNVGFSVKELEDFINIVLGELLLISITKSLVN